METNINMILNEVFLSSIKHCTTTNIIIFNKKDEKDSNVCKKTYHIFSTAKRIYIKFLKLGEEIDVHIC